MILLTLTKMKKFIITSILAVLTALGTATMAQNWPDEYLGLPGDNLNLYAVMKLFQESETLEGFERSLNDENSRINNLDLNGDNLVDYLMVIDYVDGDVHTIVLQVAIDRYEKQDVAVFTVQKFRNGAVQIQLIGDEALYGKNYIIEPVYDENYAETPNPGYIGRRDQAVPVRTTTIVIESWPLVRYIYLPNYVVWRSAWYWGYYPAYWNPWRPYYWHYYYGYHYHWHPHYYMHYRKWDHFRYARYNDFYYSSIRSHSPHVSVRIRDGHYRTTYSRPELRSEGEALYNKTQSRRDSGTSGSVANSSQERRSVSQSSQNRNSTGTTTGTSRRSTTATPERAGTGTSVERSTGTSRRSTTAAPERTGTGTSVDRSTATPRRSTTASPSGTQTGTSSSKSTSNTRRSSGDAGERKESSSTSVQGSTGSRRLEATAYTRTDAATSTGRSSSTVSRPAAATSVSRSSSTVSRPAAATSVNRSSNTVSRPAAASTERAAKSSSNSISSGTMRRISSPAPATGSYSRVETARRPSSASIRNSSSASRNSSAPASGTATKRIDSSKDSDSGTGSRRR